MKITDQHVAWAAEILKDNTVSFGTVLSPRATELCLDIIIKHSDRDFNEKKDQLILEAIIAEYEWTIVPLPQKVTMTLNRDQYSIFQTLFAILGPVYCALGKTLPRVTLADLNRVLKDQTPVDLRKEALAQRYAQYNKKWAQLVASQFVPLQRIKTKVAIFVITEAFLRRLPEPLKKK